MKRRVLRAHANKRCLRILSASNQLQTPSSSDRNYAVLCDSSFLRAILLAYWQAHAPAAWREARKRQLRKAAAASAVFAGSRTQTSHQPQKRQRQKQEEVNGFTDHVTAGVSSERSDDAVAAGIDKSSQAARSHTFPSSPLSPTAAIAAIARLPVQLPATSPVEFLNALMQDAFQVDDTNALGGDDDVNTRKRPRQQKRRTGNNKNIGFLYHCLPETITALHRMREATSTNGAAIASTATTTAAVKDMHKKDESVAARAALEQPSQHRNAPHHMNATERWLAASFGSLATEAALHGDTTSPPGHSIVSSSLHGRLDGTAATSAGGRKAGIPAPSLTFQEIPAVVVNALLSRLSLLQDPHSSAAADHSKANQSFGANGKDESEELVNSNERGGSQGAKQKQTSPPSPQAPPQRNESKAIAEWMLFNQLCLTHDAAPSSLSSRDSFGFAHVRLCNVPRFTDHTGALGHHALKRRRKSVRAQAQTAHGEDSHDSDNSQQQGGNAKSTSAAQKEDNTEAVVTVSSRPFLPRSFFVATQSHDVRKRLAPVVGLLRLTTNPDALWIEQRGTTYRYGSVERSESTRSHHNNDHHSNRAVGLQANSRSPMKRHSGDAHSGSTRHSMLKAAAPASSLPATPTVVSAAPQLSRADVAFMKHLGTAKNLALPEKASVAQVLDAGTAKTATTGFVEQTGAKESGAQGAAGRKRVRQKGQNPLSMKKKQRREVFRA